MRLNTEPGKCFFWNQLCESGVLIPPHCTSQKLLFNLSPAHGTQPFVCQTSTPEMDANLKTLRHTLITDMHPSPSWCSGPLYLFPKLNSASTQRDTVFLRATHTHAQHMGTHTHWMFQEIRQSTWHNACLFPTKQITKDRAGLISADLTWVWMEHCHHPQTVVIRWFAPYIV